MTPTERQRKAKLYREQIAWFEGRRKGTDRVTDSLYRNEIARIQRSLDRLDATEAT